MLKIFEQRENKGQTVQYAIVVLVVISIIMNGALFAYVSGVSEEVDSHGETQDTILDQIQQLRGQGEEEETLHAEDMEFGFMLTLSGDVSWIGKNALGGVKALRDIVKEYRGETFEIVKGDTRANPSEAQIALEKLDSAGVYALLGPGSFSIRSVIDSIQEAKLPTMILGDTPWLDKRGGKYVFRGSPPCTSFVASTLTMLTDEIEVTDYPGGVAAEKVVMLATDAPGYSSNIPLVKHICKCIGIELLDTVVVKPGKGTYMSSTAKIVDKNPDAVITSAGTADSWTIVKNLVEQGFHGPIVDTANDIVSKTFIELASPITYIENCYVSSMRGEMNASQESIDRLLEYTGWDHVHIPADQGWDMAVTELLALEAAELPKDASLMEIRQGIADHMRDVSNPPGVEVTTLVEGLKALEEGKDIDYRGIYGERNLDEYGEFQPIFPIASIDTEAKEWVTVSKPDSDLLTETVHCVLEKRGD